jgi:hypothetical protein
VSTLSQVECKWPWLQFSLECTAAAQERPLVSTTSPLPLCSSMFLHQTSSLVSVFRVIVATLATFQISSSFRLGWVYVELCDALTQTSSFPLSTRSKASFSLNLEKELCFFQIDSQDFFTKASCHMCRGVKDFGICCHWIRSKQFHFQFPRWWNCQPNTASCVAKHRHILHGIQMEWKYAG